MEGSPLDVGPQWGGRAPPLARPLGEHYREGVTCDLGFGQLMQSDQWGGAAAGQAAVRESEHEALS